MASPEGTSIQTVKLKVLYTFDTDQKDNHLARWPQSLEVNTCFVDSTNQIGVVDLRTCLEAVNTASPELSSRADADYAIYAYDYSEEDIPLVGQGMLSKALSPDQEQDCEAMITGRVTKGMMGLLSKNAQPTLEVKLRLKPVSSFMSQRTRSGSVSSQDGRTSQWVQNGERPASPLPTPGLESMQRMLSEGGPPRERTGSIAIDIHGQTKSSSRPGTPTLVQSFNPPQRQNGEASRPTSRAGSRKPSSARRDSFNSGYYSGEENLDDGPARKRAKTSKVGGLSKTNLNIEKQPDSLRVAASTASSVRLHRPVAIKPGALPSHGLQLDEPFRPPTPVPATKTGRPKGRPPLSKSKLHSQTNIGAELAAAMRLPPPNIPETAMSSPEDNRARSVSSTPANIPSSPPVMQEQPANVITSPALPPMRPNNADSGFMSGNLDDLFGDDQMIRFEDYLVDKPDDHANDMYSQPDLQNPETDFATVFDDNDQEMQTVETDSNQSHILAVPDDAETYPKSQSFTAVNNSGLSSPKIAPAPFPRARQVEAENKGMPRSTLPPVAASDPAGRAPLHRSKTWAAGRIDALMSEAPSGDDVLGKGKKKVGREQTQARLENAIKAGEAPPFCNNCGAIETPAWRRGYAKEFLCAEVAWADVETGLHYGACVFKERKDLHDDGTLKSFKGFKTEKLPLDEADGWCQITLCNPCGLWFHKSKCPRPKEKWQKNAKPRGRRKRPPQGPRPRPKKPSVNAKSDAATPASDESSPQDTATEAPDGDDYDQDVNTAGEDNADANEPELPPMQREVRASSAGPTVRAFRRTHQIERQSQPQRQVRSSPGQHRGSEAAPIEVDLTPNPVRRQLFPSPDKPQIRSDPQVMQSTQSTTHVPAFVRRSPRLTKTRDVFQIPGIAGAVAITADGKENMMIEDSMLMDEEMRALFTLPPDIEMPPPPMTPTPQRRSDRLCTKTPQRQFGVEISPNAQRSPTFKTPRQKQHQHPVAHALLGTVKKDLADMTPFTRSIQEALHGQLDDSLFKTPDSKKGSKKQTPNQSVNFDFPDLPSLKDSSPMTGDRMFAFNLSELTTDQLQTDMNDMFSTDAPMPSSPPGFYSFEDEDEQASNDWGATFLNDTPERTVHHYPDPDEMSLAPITTSTLRRSPRKIKPA